MAWISLLGQLAAAGISAYAQSQNQPGPTQTTVPAQGKEGPPAESVFKQNVPNQKTPIPQKVSMAQNIDPGLQAMTLQPGKVEADIQKGIGQIGVPLDSKGQPLGSSNMPSVGQTLSALGPALAQVAPLIFNQQDPRIGTSVVHAQGGGSGGAVVPGFNLPQMRRPTIGELLQSLPRPRYG